MFSFSDLTHWIDSSLRLWMSDGWTLFIEFVLTGVMILLSYAILALILILVERKVCAWMQCRLGPNRVGPWGLFQTGADMIKILLKEIVNINRSDNYCSGWHRSLSSSARCLPLAHCPLPKACRLSTSTSACFTCWLCRLLAWWAFCWQAGQATANTP